MYLALTWLALRHNIDLEGEAALSKLANGAKIEVASLAEEGYNSVFVNSLEVEARVSRVAKVIRVREALVAQQRFMAQLASLC